MKETLRSNSPITGDKLICYSNDGAITELRRMTKEGRYCAFSATSASSGRTFCGCYQEVPADTKDYNTIVAFSDGSKIFLKSS